MTSDTFMQVYKLISVMKVTDLSDVPFIARELMLIKVPLQFLNPRIPDHMYS